MREQFEIPAAAHGCALLHVLHYNVPLLYRGKLIVSIHDLIHLTREGHNGKLMILGYAWVMLRMAARRADRIITVSEYSKRQLVEQLGVSESKITVIPNGVGSQFHPIDKAKAASVVKSALFQEKPYFLCMSSLRPHKNLGSLLKAAEEFWIRTKSDWELLIVGDGPQAQQLIQEVDRLNIGDKVHFERLVPEHLLRYLYGAAEFVILPSLAEGFGLPVLEAMACGTPTLCSRSASLPEVGGDAAVYFDALNISEMAAAMELVFKERTLASILVAKGLARAALFSWHESARRHYQVYVDALSN
jgi:glycosyltransferase involved in cell wall biosynthesis